MLVFIMINPRLVISLLIILASIEPANGQFINLQIKVESELSATVEQDLDFGELIINSGASFINLGDVNMGIFNIRAYYTQNVFVQLDYPRALTHTNPSVIDEIPINLEIAYNNSGTRNINDSEILENNLGYLPVFSATNDELNNTTEVWKELFLYVYGSIIVGNINEGEYSGEILLLIEYD